MTESQTVHISPEASLTEATAMNEHYRQRNLILSQAVHELRMIVRDKYAEIERLTPKEPDDAEEASVAPKKPSGGGKATAAVN